MKKIFILIAFFTVGLFAYADERTESEMLAIAGAQLNGAAKGIHKAPGTQVKIKKISSAEMYNVYTRGSGDGFVIVSKDNSFTPVLGYSESTFDIDNASPSFKWWLEQINASLKMRAAAGQPAKVSKYIPVENFVKSKWGQEKPYYSLTPTVDGAQTLTGCVATAMAQILFYYKYPESSTGSGYYTLNEQKTQYPVELSSTYVWGQIKNQYTLLVTSAQKKAVGQLLYDCGVASGMDYSVTGSGTFLYRAALGFARNLRFDSLAIHYADRDVYADAEWMDIIYRELASKRPILYGGVDGTYGHAFLFSGVDNDGKIWVNWGWNGVADGFYDIADLAPTSKILGSAEDMHFNTAQDMVYGITPNPDFSEIRACKSEWATVSRYSLSASDNSVVANLGVAYNYHYLPFSGDIVLIAKKDGTEYPFVLRSLHDVDPRKGAALFGLSANLATLPEGQYKAYVASKSSSEQLYQPIRTPMGAIDFDLTKDASGITIGSYQNVNTGVESVKTIVPGTITRVYTTDGKLVYSVPSSEFSISDVPATGLLIVKTGSKVVKVVK